MTGILKRINGRVQITNNSELAFALKSGEKPESIDIAPAPGVIAAKVEQMARAGLIDNSAGNAAATAAERSRVLALHDLAARHQGVDNELRAAIEAGHSPAQLAMTIDKRAPTGASWASILPARM